MKKTFPKIVALFVAISMLMSFAGCSFTKEESKSEKKKSSKIEKEDKDEDEDEDEEEDEDDEDEDEDETEESEESEEIEDVEVKPFEVQKLPSEPYNYSAVHPYHVPGSVTGDEAGALLKEIEMDFLREELDNYVDVTILLDDYEAYGLNFSDINYGEVNFDEITEEDMEDEMAWLDQLLTIDYEALDENDRLTYEKLVYDLEESIYLSQFTEYDYMTPVFNSFTSLQCDLLFVLDILDFETVEDAENYLLVLESLKPYFDDLCTYEELRAEKGYACSDTAYEGVGESFDNLYAQKDDCFLYESFKTRLKNIEDLTDEQSKDLISRHETIMKETVFPTFQECADRMRALKGNCKNELGLCYYEGGEDLYAAIVRQKSNSQITPAEAAQIFDQALVNYLMVYVAALQNPDLNLDFDLTAGDVQENLDFLYGEIFNYFPEVPAHEYQLRDVPKVFQDSFSPAAYLGYHLDNYDSNLILINTAASEVNFGTTVAHEGYPGHMYQSLFTRTVSTHPYMILTGSTGYKEGWAQYVEIYSAQFFDIDEDQINYYMAETLLNLTLMARVDVGVNYEGWDAADAVAYFKDLFGVQLFTADSIQNVMDICIADPGYPLPYALGYYNTNKIISAIRDDHKNLSEKEVFEAYLNAQTGTFEQIEESIKRQLG